MDTSGPLPILIDGNPVAEVPAYSQAMFDALKAQAGDTGWIAVTLKTGWDRANMTFAPPRVRRVGAHVELQGVVKRSGGTAQFCNIPAQFRPSESLIFTTRNTDGATGSISIYTNGDIDISTSTSSISSIPCQASWLV